jgi:glycosyltransferase involved in cell wall biosynthesis
MDSRLVFITQYADPEHPLLAATVPKIAALAERSDEVVVLANGAERSALPDNAPVRLFSAPGKLGRGLRFESALAAELAGRRRPAAVIAHMCPIYAVLAAPLARTLGVPVLLWYTHWSAGRTLRAAERLSNAVITVDRRSFPIDSAKVNPIGHGVDVHGFRCLEPRPGDGTLRVLVLGRYSPAKGVEAILESVRMAAQRGVDVRLEIRGPTLTRFEEEHRARLESTVSELGLGDRVHFADAVAWRELPEIFAANDVLVNNMRPGAPDKVVYEAAASCLPVIASNPAFETLLDERFRFETDDISALADRLANFAAMDDSGRRLVGREVRRRVVAQHSVGHWADRVLAVVRETNGRASYVEATPDAHREFSRRRISAAAAGASASRKSQGTR